MGERRQATGAGPDDAAGAFAVDLPEQVDFDRGVDRDEPWDRGQRRGARGFWSDRTFDEFLRAAVDAAPAKTALVADRADRPEPLRFNYRELEDRVARVAAALEAPDVGAGDVVAVQLPNWWGFVVTALACGRIGAVVNPLMPIFRERELGYMLGFAEPGMQQRFAGFGVVAKTATPQRLGEMVAEDVARRGPVIRDNAIRTD